MLDCYNSKNHKVVEHLVALGGEQSTECAAVFDETDWARELQWTSSLFEPFKCKTTLTHGDTNFLNILVKNFPGECATSLIDFETATYSYRGIDIGGHFLERMYDWSLPESKLTGYPAPDIVERRSFCESYRQEMQILGTMGIEDTVEQLVLESQIGQMHQLISVTLMVLVLDDVEEDPFFLEGQTHMMRLYHQLKKEFQESR